VVADIDTKPVAELAVGEWAQVNGKWAQVQACATDRDGWTHLDLKGWLIPDLPMYRTVEVPWSPNSPEGAA
jgi:hypothetical protein